MNDERQSTRCDLGDRNEILLRIVGYRRIKARIHHERIDGHQQVLAVRRSARCGLRADVAAGAGLVLNDDRVIPALSQFLAEDAREQVRPRARRERDVEPDWLLRLPVSQRGHHRRKGRGENPQHRTARMHAACGIDRHASS